MSAFRRASVMVGDVETSYQRGGRGASVLMLVPAPRDMALLESIAERHRVVIPDSISVLALPALGESSAFVRWLRGFLDGLGIHSVTVVAPRALASELRAFALMYPEHVAELVWVDAMPVDWAAVGQQLASPRTG